MNIKSLKKGCCIALAVYIVLALAFYWIGGDQLHYRDVETDMLSAGAPIGEITKDTVITQQIEQTNVTAATNRQSAAVNRNRFIESPLS